jgi:serine/threonine protein kinase
MTDLKLSLDSFEQKFHTSATGKFQKTGRIDGADCIVHDFLDRLPETHMSSLISPLPGPEQIKVNLLHDTRLQTFLKSLQSRVPQKKTEQELISFIMTAVTEALGGASFEREVDEEKTSLKDPDELPFVFIGTVIDTVKSRAGLKLGGRYRSILMKLIADHTREYPSLWGNQSLHVKLYRAICQDGRYHYWNTIVIGKEEKVIDLEQCATFVDKPPLHLFGGAKEQEKPKVVFTQPKQPMNGWVIFGQRSALRIMGPGTRSPQPLDQMLKPFGLTPADFNLDEIKKSLTVPTDMTLPLPGLSVSGPPSLNQPKPVSMTELSASFEKNNFLAFGDQVNDGFQYKALKLNAQTDPYLEQTCVAAMGLMRFIKGEERRAIVLGKFVCSKLSLEETKEPVIPRLLHRALLFKYLADKTVLKPLLWSCTDTHTRNKSEPVRCSLQFDEHAKKAVVMVMVDTNPLLLDLSSASSSAVKLVNVTGQEFKDEAKDGRDTAKTKCVPYADLKDYKALRPGTGTVKWNGREVTMKSSFPGYRYDTSRFMAELEVLQSARHYHIAQVLGFTFHDASGPPQPPTLGGSTAVPQLIGLFEHLPGLTLFEILKSGRPVPVDDRVRACLQIAQAISHFHGLAIPYGNLNPSNIYIDPTSYDIKLSGMDIGTRYALRAAIPPPLNATDLKMKDEAKLSEQQTGAAFWPDERLADPMTINLKTDVYSLGIVMYSVMYQCLPPLKKPFPKTSIPEDMRKLIIDCIALNPTDRPSIDMIVDKIRACIDLKTLMHVTDNMQWHAGQGPTALETAQERASIAASAANAIAPVAERSAQAQAINDRPAPKKVFNVPSPAQAQEAENQLRKNALEDGNGPMEVRFGDQPTVEQCDAVREQALTKLGLIDKKMLVGEHVATCAMYIIHRMHTGNVALVTRGLSDPINDDQIGQQQQHRVTGLGVELIAEAKESEVGTGKELGASYLFQMMHEVAGNCRQFGLKLYELISTHGLVSMELNNTEAPQMFTDPSTNRTCALLGIPSPDVIENFMMPGNSKVLIVTVRLLTFEECIVIRRFGAAGRKAIADLFARDGTHHVSSIRQPPRPPLDMDIREIKTNPLGATEAMLMTGRGPAAAASGGRIVVVGEPTARKPSESVLWDDDKVRRRLIDLQRTVLGQATGATNALPPLGGAAAAVLTPPPPQLIALPDIDERTARCALDVKAVFPQFAKPTAVSNAMARFDMRMRQIIGSSAHPSQALAKHIQNALSTQTQLAGWKHVQDFIIDPKAYSEGLSGITSLEPVPRVAPPTGPIDTMLGTSERLVRRLLLRLEWLLDLQTRVREEFDPDLFLHVVALDLKWMDESTSFIRDAELKVTDLLKKNSVRFGLFRDLQKRGVHWPHTTRLRKDIESAGFVFKPMMVKRDRCICELCGMEVAGWRPWHNPWQMHNLVRHSADFHERVSRFGTAYPQTGLYTFTIGPARPQVPPQTAAAAAAVAPPVPMVTRVHMAAPPSLPPRP